MRALSIMIALLMSVASGAFARPDPIVVHEWGTFTSLQDETGRAIGGINDDVEPLPPFVHEMLRNTNPFDAGKSIPVDSGITMRLETPVVYFHLPPGSGTRVLDFVVEFRGGLLTQYFPDAWANLTPESKPRINPNSRGTLKWKNLLVGTSTPGPKTDSHVWLAPRNVNAANVSMPNGESERYLFYRGVGAIDSPLKVERLAGEKICIHGATDRANPIWYFDVQHDGKCAFRRLDPTTSDKPGLITAANFETADYRDDSLSTMRAQMKTSLVSAGLFDDEAEAMLNTWQDSYFKTPGTRVFFIAPKAWVDERLPIKLSEPAKVERVFVGRIDLVTPRHRDLLRSYTATADDSARAKVYQELGRFAGAMLRDAQPRPRP